VILKMSLSGIPVLILEKDTKRTHGRNALQSNIMAATAIAEMVRSSLGPRGMDKMLVDSIGDVTITNDGAEILKKIEVRHPAAKIIIQASKTQDDEAGDGTTTVVVVAGELLKQAQLLLEKGIHPSIIIKGYRLAAEEALKYLNEIAIEAKDDKTLMNVAKTTMNSKIISGFKDYLAKLVVDAVKQVAEEVDGTIKVDLNFIKIIKKEGEDISSTQLVKGVVVDKELKNDNMPKLIRDAKIAIVNPAIKLEKTELDANIRISSPEDIIAFKQKEEELVRNMVEKIKAIGASVILCQREIDDLAAGMMAKYNIMGVQNVAKRDLQRISKATGAKLINNLDDLSDEYLGSAGIVEARQIADSKYIFVEDCKNPKAVTIVLRGGTEHVVNEVDRSIHDALAVVRDVVEDGKVVPGGGAVEMALARHIEEYADKLSGKVQHAVRAFAKSLEIVPRTLAENAGLDPIDMMAKLHSAHEEGKKTYGVDLYKATTKDMVKAGVLEPLRVKTQVIKSASEVAQLILRIDDVIAAKKREMPKGPAGPGMGGMGMGGMGMGGMGGMPPM